VPARDRTPRGAIGRRVELPAVGERRRTGRAGRARRRRRRRRPKEPLAKATKGYVEAPAGSIAIAAAATTAAFQGNPVTGPNPFPSMRNMPRRRSRVAGETSELAEPWDDADESDWRESLEDLSERPCVALR
jgi:hypothetical protein